MAVGQSWNTENGISFLFNRYKKIGEILKKLAYSRQVNALLLQIKNMFGFYISDIPVVRNLNRQQRVKFWRRQLHCEIFM